MDVIIGQRLKNYRCSVIWIFVEANEQLKLKVSQFIVNDDDTGRLSVPHSVLFLSVAVSSI